MSFLPSRIQSGKSLYKQIFDSDSPEQYVRSVPSQSLYLSFKERGIESSYELIEILPQETFRMFLDFDLWQKDSINEDSLWDWIRLSDEDDPLKFVQKFVKCVDLKIVSWLMSKYVKTIIFEQNNENPPGAQWSTPDKGFTWILVDTEDSEKYFYLNRLLALIFETSAELFYQLLAIPNVSTMTLLEEEAFQDKVKRISAEGVPDTEFCLEINAPLLPYQAKELLNEDINASKSIDIPVIDPLVYSSTSSKLEPFDQLFLNIKDPESALSELTLILNASIQFFNIPFYEIESVNKHAKKVRGAINIGLEKACENKDITPSIAFEKLGLIKLYRLGLFKVLELRKLARSAKIDELKALQENQPLFSIFANCREEMPELPNFIKDDGSIEYLENKELSSVSRAFEHLFQLEQITNIIKEAISK